MINPGNRRYCRVCGRHVEVNVARGRLLPHFGASGACPNGGELINATAKRVARCHGCGRRRTVKYECWIGGRPLRYCRECAPKSITDVVR